MVRLVTLLRNVVRTGIRRQAPTPGIEPVKKNSFPEGLLPNPRQGRQIVLFFTPTSNGDQPLRALTPALWPILQR